MGVFDEGSIIHTEECASSSIQIALNHINERFNPMGAVISNVGRVSKDIFNDFTARQFLVNSRTPMPIRIEYETIDTLGVDRLLGVVAGHVQYPYDEILVIDAGTCITYDLCASGVYKGGAISPGLQMRLDAMHNGTAQLPQLNFSGEAVTIGTSTESSMMMGAGIGLLSEIDGMIDNFRIGFPELKVILTGGNAAFVEKHSKNAIFAAPNLILHGLHAVYMHNVPFVNE